MPSTADYRTNDLGTQGKYKIILDAGNDGGIGLNLWHDPDGNTLPIRGQFGPFEMDQEQPRREDSIIFDDFSNGVGQAWRGFPNSAAFTINGYTRSPRAFLPAGRLTEIPLPETWTADELAGDIRRHAVSEHQGDIIIGAGQHILRIPGGDVDMAPIDEYNLGAGVQIQNIIIYNGHALVSTDLYADDWQYLTGWNPLSNIWETAALAGTLATRPVGPNYVEFAKPVYLEHMVKVFQEIDGTGGTRIFGNNGPMTYVYTQTDDFDSLIGNTELWSGGGGVGIGTTGIPVGDSSYAITGMFASNRVPFIAKEDGVYSIESAGIYHPNLTTYMQDNISRWNGASGKFHNGYLFVSTPTGIDRVDVASRMRIDIAESVNPSFFFSNETPIFGPVTAMTDDQGWLATSFFNGQDSHLMYTIPREKTISNMPSQMVWHGSECTIEGEEITMLYTADIGSRRVMFIGTHDGVRMHLYWLSLAIGNPLQDYLNPSGEHIFETGDRSTRDDAPIRPVQLYLPIEDWGDGNAKKVIRRFDLYGSFINMPQYTLDGQGHTVVGEELRAAEIDVYANADTGSLLFYQGFDPESYATGWSFQGTAASNRASFIPSGSSTEGYQIAVMLSGKLFNMAPEEAPYETYAPFVVRTFKVRATKIVEQMEEREYTVQLGYLEHNLQGGRVHSDAHYKFARLYELQNSGPVGLIDEWGEHLIVKVEPGITYELRPEKLTQPWTIVTKISVSILGRPFYYDTGSLFDAIYAWAA